MDGCEDPENASSATAPTRGVRATPDAVLHIEQDATLPRNAERQFVTADGSHDGWTSWISQQRNKAVGHLLAGILPQ
jgi:hypothetical protein